VNYAQHWFEYFPNPPINILGMIENVIGHHDRYLLQHFVKYNVTSQVSYQYCTFFTTHKNHNNKAKNLRDTAYRFSEAYKTIMASTNIQ